MKVTIQYRLMTIDGDVFTGEIAGPDGIGISGGSIVRIEDTSGVDLWVPVANISNMKTEG